MRARTVRMSAFAICLMMFTSTFRAQNEADRRPAAAQLLGAWRFVSDQQRLPDGTTRRSPQWGPHGVGYLIYSDKRVMCAMLANPDRSPMYLK